MRALFAAMGSTLDWKRPSAMLGSQYRWRPNGPGPKRARRERVPGVLASNQEQGVLLGGCGVARDFWMRAREEVGDVCRPAQGRACARPSRDYSGSRPFRLDHAQAPSKAWRSRWEGEDRQP